MISLRQAIIIVLAAAGALLLYGCSGSPETTAKWYLKDKPADLRVPVPDQSDPGSSGASEPETLH